MSKLAIAMATVVMLLAAGVADANGGHGHRGHHNGGHYRGGGYRGGYYRGGGYGWGGGFAVYPRVFIGGPGPFWWGNPYPYGYYQRPLVVVPSPPQPQVYVQQPEPPQYWYYCEDPRGYYPYVPQCRNEWLQVVPRMDAPNQ